MTRPLPAAFLSLALALAAASPANAQPVGQPGRSRLTPEQQKKIFPESRDLALRDRRARIGILQTAERCIATASASDALRSCMRTERTAVEQQRQQHFSAMKALFERNGIPIPEWSRGGRGRPGRPGGPAPGAAPQPL